MKTAQHTPGPWSTDYMKLPEDPGHFSRVWGGGADGDAVIVATCSAWSKSKTQANARLIAAAPDMLDALDNAPIHRLDETPEQFIERYKQWYRETRNAAIAKAKGQ